MTVTRVFYAAEGQMDFSPDRRPIYIGNASFDIAHCPKGSAHIPGIDRTRETVAGVVQDRDSFFKAIDFDHRQYRTKNLFLSDAHRGRHLIKDGRLEKIAVRAR